jgi:hypothetical protein
MAQWLKVEGSTPDKPEIREAARLCKITQPEAFLAWFRTWSWLDASTNDGLVNLLRPEDIDDVARVKGFGAAMAAVHWITFDRHGGAVANWDRHNGKAAKQRALNTQRQRRARA